MKKMLIVGGAGYIGGYLVDIFKKRSEYDITVLDSLLFETRYFKNVNFINADVRDTEYLETIINNYDIVVWLAAIVGDGACAVDINLTNSINYESVKWLVNTYKKGTIVFTSTCSVYGMNNDLIDETATPNPLSAYASTKLAAEQYIVQNAKDYLIFRLGTLHGISDDHSRLRLDLVVNVLTKKAVSGEKLSVFGGEQWRPLLHVKDVSNAIEYCLDNNIRGLYNLSESNLKIYEIAEVIQKIIPNTQVEMHNMKFEDLRNYRVTNSKILNTGWKPKLSVADGIKELKEIFEQKRVRDAQDVVYHNENFMKYINKGGKYGFHL